MERLLTLLRNVCRALFVFPWHRCGDCEGDEFCARCGMALRFY